MIKIKQKLKIENKKITIITFKEEKIIDF